MANLRFSHKLLTGFAVIGIIMVLIFLNATRTIDTNSNLLQQLIDIQMRQLARINHLQAEANHIRLLEAELPRLTDVFATTGTISQLRQKSSFFETDLQTYLADDQTKGLASADKLLNSWHLYAAELQQTMTLVEERAFERALENSTFDSLPRFRSFAATLATLSSEIESDTRQAHRHSLSRSDRARKTFLLLSLTGIFLSVLFALVLSRSLSTRLDLLRQGAMELAEGRGLTPLYLKGRDEIAALASVFNQMRSQVMRREGQLLAAQKQLEERVEERTRELKEANKELDAFVYTLSHDLRSPLSTIATTVDFLRMHDGDKLDEVSVEFLQDIERQSERMLQLMEDLLDLARVGEVAKPAEAVACRPLVEETIEGLEKQYPERQVRIRLGEMPNLHVPRTLLRQVFDNLLTNAVKYGGCPVGRPIVVGSLHLDQTVRFFVRDHGDGIPEEERENIFQLFYRGKKASSVEGTGVGLATIAKIARLYDGRAWVEPTPGGGATFWVEIRTGLELAEQGADEAMSPPSAE